ncbi:hypothetical protein BDN71DRAFT_1444114, partial [Pleurotus eryngii]
MRAGDSQQWTTEGHITTWTTVSGCQDRISLQDSPPLASRARSRPGPETAPPR